MVTNSNPTKSVSGIITVFDCLNKWYGVKSHQIFEEPFSYNLQLKMDPKLTWM
jgi:hypothetical protein